MMINSNIAVMHAPKLEIYQKKIFMVRDIARLCKKY